jgi:alcohol dehydrogenase class IV
MGVEEVCLVPNNFPGNVLVGKRALEKLEIPEGKILIITDKGIVAAGMVEKLVRRFPDSEIFSELLLEFTTADMDKSLDFAQRGTIVVIEGFCRSSASDTVKAVVTLINSQFAIVDTLGNYRKLYRFISFLSLYRQLLVREVQLNIINLYLKS